jgi:hypothetical protein
MRSRLEITQEGGNQTCREEALKISRASIDFTQYIFDANRANTLNDRVKHLVENTECFSKSTACQLAYQLLDTYHYRYLTLQTVNNHWYYHENFNHYVNLCFETLPNIPSLPPVTKCNDIMKHILNVFDFLKSKTSSQAIAKRIELGKQFSRQYADCLKNEKETSQISFCISITNDFTEFLSFTATIPSLDLQAKRLETSNIMVKQLIEFCV